MNEDGFTLADMLAALLILSLAMAGLGQGLYAMSRLQRAAAETAAQARDLRAISGGLDQLLGGAGPFGARADDFQGQADRLSFTCGQGARCEGRLEIVAGQRRLRIQDADAHIRIVAGGPAGTTFRYLGSTGEHDHWPTGQEGRLLAVRLRDIDGALLANHRLWRDQPVECAFDAVRRDCYFEPAP